MWKASVASARTTVFIALGTSIGSAGRQSASTTGPWIHQSIRRVGTGPGRVA
jgi:hypothetical protein